MTSVGLGLTSDQVSRLTTKLRGPVFGPADLGLEGRRIPFNAMHSDRPDVVVLPTGTADVADAVRFAQETASKSAYAAAATRSPAVHATAAC